MVEVSALLFTLLAEGTGLLSVILIIWIIVVIRKKGKDKNAAKALVENIKLHSGERLDAIKSFLSDASALEGEELLNTIKRIDRVEKDFFTALVRLYLKRDETVLSSIDETFDKVITAYKENISSQEGGSSSAATDDGAQDKIDALEKEKQSLLDELRITKATMGNMMSEFNTMFNGGDATIQTSSEALKSTMSEVDEETPAIVVPPAEEPTPVENVAAEEVPSEAPKDIDDSGMEDVFFSGEAEAEDDGAPKAIDDSGMEDVFFSADDAEPSAPTSISEPEEDFGSIVSTDDVDDLLDGIDLSEEIDIK